ncbi:MAG: hypothetical protein ACRCX8_08495 [Sarcina sp.]
MNKEMLKKTESMLYKYYDSVNHIARLKSKIVLIDKTLEKVKLEIKNLNEFETDVYSNMGIDYSKDMVQTSSQNSNEVERAMIKYINKLEKTFENKLNQKLKYSEELREIEFLNHDIEFNLNMLAEDKKQFIEYKYKHKKSMKWIAIEVFSGIESTAFRKRDELIKDITNWNNESFLGVI